MVKYHDAEGGLVAVGHRTFSAAEHQQALAGIKRTSMDLTQSGVLGAAHFSELETQHKGQRALDMAGREWLCEVGLMGGANNATYNAGDNIFVIPLSPASVGGRLGYILQEFQQNRVKHARVIYVPSVPATTTGAVAMYYVADPTQVFMQIGTANMLLASSTGDFVAGPVWESMTLNINPQDITQRYFDATTGDARLSTQGMLVIMCAGAFTLTGALPSMGQVYFEYDIEFFAPRLDYSGSFLPSNFYGLIQGSVTTGAVAARTPIKVRTAAIAAGWLQASTGLALVPTTEGRVLCMTVQSVTGDFLTGNISWTSGEDGQEIAFRPGQTVFAKFWSSSSVNLLILCGSLTGALEQTIDVVNFVPTLSDDTMCWGAGFTFTQASELRFIVHSYMTGINDAVSI